jgi:hypothetical protein
MPKCSHCLIDGHTKKTCPSIDLPPTPPPEKDPPANRWTPEKEQLLMNLWKVNPLHYDMETISNEVGMSKGGCDNRLNELIPVEEQVKHNSLSLTINDITRYIDNLRTVCDNCLGVYYCQLKEWCGKNECYYCYRTHKSSIDETWMKINNYLEQHNKNGCYFCKRKRDNIIGGFHFDHINMFEKNDNICSMVDHGSTLEEIIEEINKCQLICISCHNIITTIERNLGYHRLKSNITKKTNAGLEIETTYLKEQYSKNMIIVYQKMSEMFYPNVFSLV